jgi:hypothetical protein
LGEGEGASWVLATFVAAAGSFCTSAPDGRGAIFGTGSFVPSCEGSSIIGAAGVCGRRGSGGTPFVFGREVSEGTALFLLAKAWSSFSIRSSHSPLSISPISP